MYNLIISRKRFLEGEIASLERAIKRFPEGKLEIYKDRGSTRWFVKTEASKREYIPKAEIAKADALGRRMIMDDLVNSYQTELEGINEYLKRVDECGKGIFLPTVDFKVSEFLGENNKKRDDEAWKWANEPFFSNPSFRDKLVHKSPSGHLLRSKSEKEIDKALFERGIPFRYECVLSTNGGDEFPDFTFYKPQTGEYRYWEHNGMMDSEDYRKKYKRAMSNYLDSGIYPGINLICTYESKEKPLSYEEVERNVAQIEAWYKS